MNDNDLRVRFGLGGWKQPPLRRYQILYKSYTQAVGNWVTANCVSTEWYPNRHEGILNLRRGITAIGGGNSADYSPFYGDSMVMAVDLSATQITAVDDYAFYGCTRLSSIVLRNDTTSIGDSAFSATNLPYFSVPNGVTTIGNYAFQQSASLVTLTISSGVTSIGNYALNGCSALTNVTCLAEEPPTLGEGNTAPSGCILYVLPTALEAYQSDASWSAAFSSIQPLGNYAYITVGAGEHGTASGSGWYEIGTTATITATPDEHYHFTAWSDGNTDNPRTITVTDDATYTASFAVDTFTLTVTGDEYTTVTGSGTYPYGTEVEITATPAEHYHFTAWSDGDTNATRTITVTSDITLSAASAIDTFTVTLTGDEYTTVTGSGTYPYGTEVNITAVSAEHYHFVTWSDGNTNVSRYITVTSDVTLSATSAINQYTLTVTGDAHTTVSGSGTYDYGTLVQITATPDEHYHFTAWNDGNMNATRTVMVTDNATYTAASAINQYTITVNAAEHGTASGSGTYDYGTSVQISATPDTGYEFTQWNDGNTSNPRTITVTGNATYTAAFEEEAVNVIRYTSTNQATGEWVRLCTYTDRNTYNSQTGNGALYLRDTTTTLGALMGTGNLPTDWSPFNNDDGLTSVDLSDSRLTTLGECAFTGCDALTTVTIGNNITTVGRDVDMWGAFEDCTTLQSITLPSNVTSIGSGAFYNCTNLTTVTCNATTPPTLGSSNFGATNDVLYVPEASVNAYISNSSWSGAFNTINNYAKINAIAGQHGSASGSGWYEIGTTATLTATPNTGYEFTAWSDGNTDNPRTISVVGYATYTASFDVEAGVIRYTSTNQATGDWVTNNTNTSRNTYDSVTGEGVLYLNNGVTTIGGGSDATYTPFRQDTGLTSIDFSDSRLTTLGSYTCQGCTQLTSVTIGNTITTIGTASDTWGVFEGCSALTSITIPSGVTTIGKYAFGSCTNLATVTCNATTPPTLGSSNFGSAANDVLYVPEASINAYYNDDTWRNVFAAILPIGTTKAIVYEAASQATGNWVTNNTNTSKNYYNSTKQVGYLYLNDGVTSIGGGGSTDNSPFYQNSDLTSVNLAFSGLTAINNYAFRASTLTTVTLPSTLTSFGNSVFRQCASLVTVKNFENTAVTTRQDKEGLFMDCTALKNITLPPALTLIGYADFRSCSALTTIDLPSTITTIGSYAFYGCSNLKTVTCRATTPPTLNGNNFNATGDTLKVPSARVSTYQNNSSWSAAFTTITSI